jgi:hypothetical protein
LKSLTLLFILLTIISCRKEEGIWDKLTPAEQDAVRARAESQCLSTSAAHFSDFKTTSGDLFYDTAAYAVGTTFNHTFKEGEVTDYTHKITVWKVTATDVYLLIFIDDSTDIYKFVKIPKTTNEAMITELQTKYCDRSATEDPDFSLSTSAKTYTQVNDFSTKKNTHTFTYSFSLLAFLSSYKETRSEQPLDTNGDATGTATTMTGTLSEPTTETNIPEFDTYAEYLAKYPTATLCIVNSSYDIPYELVCDATGATTFLSAEL